MRNGPTSKLSWDDQHAYRWEFRPQPSGGLGRLLGALIGAALAPIFVAGTLIVIGVVLPVVAVWIAIGWTAFYILVVTVAVLTAAGDGSASGIRAQTLRAEGAMVAIGTAFYGVLAAESPIVGHLTPPGSLVDRLGFVADNVLRVVLLDTPEILDLQLSSVEAADAGGRAIILGLRLLVAWGLVELMWRAYQLVRVQEFFGTVQEAYAKCEGLSSRNAVEVRRLGRVVAHAPVVVSGEELLRSFRAQAKRER